MDSYDIGLIVGRILSFIGGFLIIYFFMKIPTMIKYMFNKIFPNPTKELLETYIFWVDFVQGINSLEELKKRLSKIKKQKVYQDEFGKVYLTYQEADAFNCKTKVTTIKDILNSEVYSLTFYYALERITMYSKEDLKYISKDSYMVWFTTIGDIKMHLAIKNDKFIYPKDYNENSEFRFGYIVVHNQDGLRGLYDVEQDKLVMNCKYKHLTSISNIIEYSFDLVEYVLYDVEQKKILETNYKPFFYDLPTFVRNRIDLSKIELKDYRYLLPKIIDKDDLIKFGLWGLDVGVLEVPEQFRDLIEENSGTIGYNYLVSADIFDMTIELPINFKKKNGEYVSLGIKIENIILDKQSRQKLKNIKGVFDMKIDNFNDSLKRGNLPDDDRVVPNWLKIKNEQYDNVDILNNNVDKIIALKSEHFNEFVSLTPTSLILIYLSTLTDDELQRFYKYLDSAVKLKDGATLSAREQFEGSMMIFDIDEITTIQKQRAILEIPLYINFAKYIYNQTIDFKEQIQAKYYPYKKDDSAIRYEGTLFKVIYSEPMKFIPDSFNQVLLHFSDYYNENNEEHRKIGLHLAKRFGLLTNALYQIQKAQDEKCDGLAWLLYTFNDEIKELDGCETLKDDTLIFYMLNTFSAILLEDDEAYITSMIDIVNELMNYYPYLDEAFLYALQELMKSVALKEMSVDNANKFLDIFINLPKLYDNLSYEKIMELKDMINTVLANDKPQDNKIFDDDKVKSKIILLNYLVDIEDL